MLQHVFCVARCVQVGRSVIGKDEASVNPYSPLQPNSEEGMFSESRSDVGAATWSKIFKRNVVVTKTIARRPQNDQPLESRSERSESRRDDREPGRNGSPPRVSNRSRSRSRAKSPLRTQRPRSPHPSSSSSSSKRQRSPGSRDRSSHGHSTRDDYSHRRSTDDGHSRNWSARHQRSPPRVSNRSRSRSRSKSPLRAQRPRSRSQSPSRIPVSRRPNRSRSSDRQSDTMRTVALQQSQVSTSGIERDHPRTTTAPFVRMTSTDIPGTATALLGTGGTTPVALSALGEVQSRLVEMLVQGGGMASASAE